MFTSAYAANGDWARLFARDDKFRETRLLQNISEPLRFITIDIWESLADYERFLEEQAGDYRELDARCAAWTNAERHLNSFDAAGPELNLLRKSRS